uniref:Uncharacterized protein n=1 Tax=Quercus lobata TaxID=97700 RepID=A0A7N2MMD6_QUELO
MNHTVSSKHFMPLLPSSSHFWLQVLSISPLETHFATVLLFIMAAILYSIAYMEIKLQPQGAEYLLLFRFFCLVSGIIAVELLISIIISPFWLFMVNFLQILIVGKSHNGLRVKLISVSFCVTFPRVASRNNAFAITKNDTRSQPKPAENGNVKSGSETESHKGGLWQWQHKIFYFDKTLKCIQDPVQSFLVPY